MGAAVQVVDWSKRSAQQWLEQYGMWVRTSKNAVSANPLAIAIDRNDKTRVRASKVSIPVEILDYEAVEITKILSKMHSDKREYLAERAWLLILKYENDWSDQTIANTHRVSRAHVRAEIANGIAYLNGLIDSLNY